jgi:5-methylcytosine-specific restriction endonuclease McrA
MRKKIPAAMRREVIKRARGLCEYCRTDSDFSDSPFDVEHIVPVSQKGVTELENLALACHGCNLNKSDKTEFFDAVSGKLSRLFNPREDIWEEHFGWTQNYLIVVGLTAVGRVTVELLELNRKGLINQRRLLYIFGQHPPK